MGFCMPRIAPLLAATMLVGPLFVACSGDSGGNGDVDAGNSGDGDGDQTDASYGEGFTVEWGPLMAEPGVEDTRCVNRRLATDRPIRVGQFHNELGLSSHHLIVYRLSEESGEVEQDEPIPCDPFVDVLDPSNGSPLAVTQRAEEVISLPPGVGISLEAGQLVRLELHYINATIEPQELRARSTFVEIPEEDFRDEADFLFVGNPDIDIPAGETFTLGPSFLPLPEELYGINIFAITGHEHQWGTGVTVNIAADEEAEGTPVYDPEDFQWDEPDTIYHDPPLQIPDGGGFRFSCSWNNEGPEDVGFGESVNDEMCFFWVYYYPSRGAKVCAHTDQLGSLNACCPSSNPLCEYIDDFLN